MNDDLDTAAMLEKYQFSGNTAKDIRTLCAEIDRLRAAPLLEESPSFAEWRILDPDDPLLRPEYGPRCTGLSAHTWKLTIEEGKMSLTSGCEDCDDTVLSPCGGEDVVMNTTVVGRLESHLEKYGYEVVEYDHWWEFVPVGLETGT